MPPNDPRFLSLTEDEILYDLLVIRYQDRIIDDAIDPARAKAEDLAASNTDQRDLVDRGKAFADDPETRKGLRALLRGGRTTKETTKRAERLVLRFETLIAGLEEGD